MKVSLARLLEESCNQVEEFRAKGFVLESYLKWLDTFQAQIVVLSTQVCVSGKFKKSGFWERERPGKREIESFDCFMLVCP